jgi:hypothetical protein
VHVYLRANLSSRNTHMIGRSYALVISNLCTIYVEDYLKGCTRVLVVLMFCLSVLRHVINS